MVEKFARQVQLEVGDVDYVINATGYDVRKGLLEHENEEIKHCIEVNLTGAIYLTKSFLLILINVVSWGMFFVGSMMGGKELVHMIWKRE